MSNIQVKGADGSTQWDNTYHESTAPPETLTLMSPLDGPWSVHVDATGYGLPDSGLMDSFKVIIPAQEPG